MIDFPLLTEIEAHQYLFREVPSDSLFIETIKGFYQRHGRPFIFRDEHDPYSVLLSEVMLQQTQTARVIEKYHLFKDRWPSFKELAEEGLDEILRAWKGLGYNRRALYLKKSAELTRAWNWTIPNNEAVMRSLPGVGKATAAALLAFSYQEKAIYLETNIRRVLLHTFFGDETNVHDRVLEEVLGRLIGRIDNPRLWYYALMDYGVLLKALIPNPNTKSAHYTKQSRFEGSKRQVRSALLHYLAEEGSSSTEGIEEALSGYKREYLKQSIDELLTEGFLAADGGILSIRE